MHHHGTIDRAFNGISFQLIALIHKSTHIDALAMSAFNS
jgi:hypothetical protein